MVIGRVGVGDVAADRRQIAHQRIGDHRDGIGEQRIALGDQRLRFEIRFTRQRADAECAIVLSDVRETVDAVDIDEMARLRQPEAHEGNETLAPGQHLGVLSELPKERDRLGDRRRSVVRELARNHGHSSPDIFVTNDL